MKFLSTALCLASSVLALPSIGKADTALVPRQSAIQITDQYLFDLTLPAFTAKRNARDPPSLIWDSDGCSSSPDNPFGFPFVPACHRHDFGYRNYKAQNRFTDAGKLSIDNNFKSDAKTACRALADVYYAAVRAFGGSTQDKRDDDLVKIYEEKVAIYNKAVEEAQAKGELWTLD
ncbi:secretory phospholipase A2 [Thermothelomyces heterothallicus CBS 203.75]